MINEDLVWEFVKHDILLRKMSCLSVLSDLEPHSLFEKLDFGRYYYLLLYGSRMGLRQSFTAWRPVSSTSSWLSVVEESPVAKFAMQENPATSTPSARA